MHTPTGVEIFRLINRLVTLTSVFMGLSSSPIRLGIEEDLTRLLDPSVENSERTASIISS